tara:strand:+ start:10134 stop:10355 length:222 start_codon:yes stop_codon:yes gene_type:complete
LEACLFHEAACSENTARFGLKKCFGMPVNVALSLIIALSPKNEHEKFFSSGRIANPARLEIDGRPGWRRLAHI